jgi:hypothetical protein
VGLSPAAAQHAAADTRLRASFESLRARELAWLRALPPARQAQLAPLDEDVSSGGDVHRKSTSSSSSTPFPAHHVLHCGEVALALLGLKPCVLFAHALWSGADGAPSFGAAFAAEVVRPWLREFNYLAADAAGAGNEDGGAVFSLHGVPSACAPFAGHPGFARGALLVAERHARAPAAKRVFLRGAPRVADDVLGAALGYPGTAAAPRAAQVTYQDTDHAPYRRNKNEEVCCVPLFEFRAAPPDAPRVGAHFRAAAAEARAALGLRLALDLSECCCDDDEQDDIIDDVDDAHHHADCWPDAAVARCWGAAFGGAAGALAALQRGEVRVSGAWTARRVLRVLSRVPAATRSDDGGGKRHGGAGA